MNQLLRQAAFSSSTRYSVTRVVSIATIGSGLLYANSNADSGRLYVSIHESLLLLPWQLLEHRSHRPSSLSIHPWHFGNLPLFSSRISPGPPEDLKKDVSVEVGSCTKQCAGCLGKDTIANAAARVAPAVIHLSVPRGYHETTTGSSRGSGTIIDSDGTILTCAHAVVDFQGLRNTSKGKVDVTLRDGRTFEGTVVSADLHSDIAIVKINSKTPLPMAKLGFSSKLRPGDWVLALGSPLSLENTVTAGIISCVDRTSSDIGLGGMRREYLQTDCSINKGNSGGPLVNIDGEIVGVNIMKLLPADGLSFAVPIDGITKIMEHFKKSGRFVRPWLGLKMIDLNELIIAQLKERDANFPNVSRGVLVPMVTPESPADLAGFLLGDVIIEFDGKPIERVKEIVEIMEDRIGVPLKVVVKRANDAEVSLTVVPEEINPEM
ncbi:putative protease Do-like 14 [Tripterygium wilfordii]|uniref:putative protease Do-like 14 n=1 Tax=Tripterygium wilfordii TaxID=458696 RepID=UPI0018F7E929|nr:putative protease Do-like 14 [Tripterygium wilfordii]